MTLVPDASMSLAAVAADSSFRSSTATRCPSEASRRLMASPMPDPPPVTMATRHSLMKDDASAGASGALHLVVLIPSSGTVHTRV